MLVLGRRRTAHPFGSIIGAIFSRGVREEANCLSCECDAFTALRRVDGESLCVEDGLSTWLADLTCRSFLVARSSSFCHKRFVSHTVTVTV